MADDAPNSIQGSERLYTQCTIARERILQARLNVFRPADVALSGMSDWPGEKCSSLRAGACIFTMCASLLTVLACAGSSHASHEAIMGEPEVQTIACGKQLKPPEEVQEDGSCDFGTSKSQLDGFCDFRTSKSQMSMCAYNCRCTGFDNFFKEDVQAPQIR